MRKAFAMEPPVCTYALDCQQTAVLFKANPTPGKNRLKCQAGLPIPIVAEESGGKRSQIEETVNNFNKAACNLFKSLGWIAPSSKRMIICADPSAFASPATRAIPIEEPKPDPAALRGAKSFLRAQDAYLQQVGAALDQMSLLAFESQNVNKSDDERAALQEEFTTLAGYVKEIAAK